MKAWDQLLANSSLSGGTAWQLLTNPKTGGTGVVLNDGFIVELGDSQFAVEVSAMEIEVEVVIQELIAEVQDKSVLVDVSTAPIEVEIHP